MNILFLCEYHHGEAVPNSQDEVEQEMWLTTEEIVSHPSAPDDLRINVKCAEHLKL